MTVSVEIHPDGRCAIEIAFSLRIDEVGALSTLDDERILLLPFLHLSKRMPEIAVVPVPQLLRRGWSSHIH
jgi:hypothetical protein